MTVLSASDLTVSFGSGIRRRAALDGVSFSLEAGERLALLGPSGAGKTTLLRCLAGLQKAERGALERSGPVALVFQDDAVFPHLSVAENLAFAFHARRVPADRERIREVARALEIDSTLSKRASLLSGGERQRVEVARALLGDPAVMLLDEPLAHLDAPVKRRAQQLIVGALRARRIGAVYVTHDFEEAFATSDRVGVLVNGKLVQCDSAERVYDYPANVDVARFLGSPPMNLLSDGATIVGVRPEHLRVVPTGQISGIVKEARFAGAHTIVDVETERGMLSVRAAERRSAGERIALTWDEACERRFDAKTGNFIR